MEAKRVSIPQPCEQCGKPFRPFLSSVVKRFCGRICMGRWNSSRPLAERFQEKLMILPSGCWSIGSGHERMYSKLFYNGKQLHGHRASWLIHRGEIPLGMFVCHDCPGGDNRWCVNPAHLFLGTIRQNNQDAMRKGRYAKPSAKITEAIAAAIRKEFKSGTTRKDLAIKYALSYPAIKKLISGTTWKSAQVLEGLHVPA